MQTQRITGTVQSGSGPGALRLGRTVTVAVYEAAPEVPRKLGSAVTDAEGRFSIDFSSPTAGGVLYAAAYVRAGVTLFTVIGPEIQGAITVNELTSVAASFAMAQFARNSAIAGDAFGLGIAAGMCHNLASPLTGDASAVMLTSPNAYETNSLRSLRALANLVAACVRERPGALEALRRLAPSAGGDPPADTFQAIVNIARNPGRNVGEIYRQAKAFEIYTPALERPDPFDAWTLVVKVNDSGDPARMFGGPANIAFDENGYAWVANNVVQGTPDSADCIMVLRPDGRPADGRNGTPTSPVSGGGIDGVGFGITISARTGHVWVGNFGWGPEADYPANGASELDAAGNPLSVPDGYSGPYRVQGIVADPEGDIWMASFGNDSLVVFPGGEPVPSYGFSDTRGEDPLIGTFGIAISGPREAWVTYSGGLGWPAEQQQPSYVCRYRFDGTAFTRLSKLKVGSVTKGIALDSEGYAWVASGGDDTVYRVHPDGTAHTGYQGGGICGPWSVAVDGDDNVWVANFGTMGPEYDYTNAALSKLAGIHPPPGLRLGDPISPPNGYTLPTGGDPVLLPNGDPLYGPGAEACFSPLMRQTSCTIDQAGNVWAVNNWKPNFATDFSPTTGNPGGDGICIFVGVARPPAPKR